MSLHFEWDEAKAKVNHRKHGVDFSEAKTIFNDPLLLTVYDSFHSVSEDRYVSVGCSRSHRVLLVAHTDHSGVIRIISSRKATTSERKSYEEKR